MLDGHKKRMRIDVERIFLSESKFKSELFKTSCTQNVSPQEFKKMIDFLFSISLPRVDLIRAVYNTFMGMTSDKSAHLIVNQTCKISAAPELFFFFFTLQFFQGIMNRIVFKAKPGRRPMVSQPALVHVIGCGD